MTKFTYERTLNPEKDFKNWLKHLSQYEKPARLIKYYEKGMLTLLELINALNDAEKDLFRSGVIKWDEL